MAKVSSPCEFSASLTWWVKHAAAQTTAAPQIHLQHHAPPAPARKELKKTRRPRLNKKRDREYDSDEQDELEEDDEELEEEEEDDEPRGVSRGAPFFLFVCLLAVAEAGGRAGGGSKNGSKQHVDITEYLCLPQSDAAVKLGLPVSTLSKRWKEAAKNRKVLQLLARSVVL